MATFVVPPLDDEPWPTLGPQVCDLIEAYACHGPGDLRARPAVIDDEKRALIYRAYEVYPKGHRRAGKRRFKRCGISLRKGSAKTELAAWVAFAELHPEGPVRCDGWRKDGGMWVPVGRPVTDPYIPMVAYTEEQTEELAYGALLVMCSEGPDADMFDAGAERVMRRGGDGLAKPMASAPDSRDGARTTFQHFDETHRMTLPRLKSAHQTMQANIPKRPLADAWSLETTTTYAPGEGSVAQGTHEYAELVAQGKAKDPTLFFFHREAGPQHNIKTERGIRAAIREASGPALAKWDDFEGQVDAIVGLYNQPDTDKAYWERVWLNRRVQAGRQAFDPVRWAELARPDITVEPGTAVALGFDGSRYNDATALVATSIADGHQWPLAVWECPTDPALADGWEVPRAQVDDAVEQAFRRLTVLRLYGDPAQGWDEALAQWAGRYGTKRVVAFFTDSRGLRKTAVAVRAYATAQRAGELSHDGSEVLARHVGNARRRETSMRDEDGQPLWLIEKERRDSPFKIDAAMAGTLSWQARLDCIRSGDTGEPEYAYTA